MATARWLISWAVSPDSMATQFNVYTREKTLDGPWDLALTTHGRSAEISIASTLARFQVAIAPIVNGVETTEEEWEIQEFTPASLDDIDAPPDVASLSASQIDGTFDVRLRWPAVSDPHLSGYEIREDDGGGSWEMGIVRGFVVANSGDRTVDTTLGITAAKSTLYMVKAVSVQGQFSANAASWTFTTVAQSGYVQESAVDESATGFLGTKDGMEVQGGSNLQLAFAPATADAWSAVANTYDFPCGWPHEGSGTYVTATQEAQDDLGNGIVVDEVVQIDMRGSKVNPTTNIYAADWNFIVRPEFTSGGTALDVNAPGPFDRIHGDETLRDGNDVAIEIDTTPDDPAGTPTWDGYREWIPGTRYRYRAMRLRFTVTSYWWHVFRISTLTIRRFRKNLKDESKVTVSALGGKQVIFTEPFTKTPQVVATAISDIPMTATVEEASITRTQCQVRVFDGGGVERTGVDVNVVAAGV